MAVSDGLTGVEFDLYHPLRFSAKTYISRWHCANRGRQSIQRDFLQSVHSVPPCKPTRPPLASSIAGLKLNLGATKSLAMAVWAFNELPGHNPNYLCSRLRLTLNLWQTVWILPLFNLGRKRQSCTQHK